VILPLLGCKCVQGLGFQVLQCGLGKSFELSLQC
jgi:hypothetical protein